MNTNAGAQDDYWWYELAQTFGRMGTVILSVDGLPDTNSVCIDKMYVGKK